MAKNLDRSFTHNDSETVTLPRGQVVHQRHAQQSEVLARRFYQVRPGVWTLVGNGLSNQTFVEGPEGIIAIDTGESTEEMREAISELRQHTDRPIVAVLYTHFHYVGGTEAVHEDANSRSMPIYGHEKVAYNRNRATSEISTTYVRGLIEQFAIFLPDSGPDGNVNVGLGHFYRNPDHAPFTSVFIPPNETFGSRAALVVAGLPIEVTEAPSDADDSVTYWFPTLGVAVHNLVWPVLFNIFAIRGEEYRDPRVLLTGLDHLLALKPEHLVATHGPPMSGADEIQQRVVKYRDSIQFLWDQSVRHINKGVLGADLGDVISLPAQTQDDFITSEGYGVAEHHVRQIRSGLFGWFDGNEAELFPLPSNERARRMITGFGGRDEVRAQAKQALADDDLRWATELATWLVRSEEGDSDDRKLLASCLRTIAQRTSAANIRSWCLTRALSLEEKINTTSLYQNNFNRIQVILSPPESSVNMLRVLLVPDLANGIDFHIAFKFTDQPITGLHVRNSVACPTGGANADATVECSIETWADVLAGDTKLAAAVADGSVVITGDAQQVLATLAVFEVEGFQ